MAAGHDCKARDFTRALFHSWQWNILEISRPRAYAQLLAGAKRRLVGYSTLFGGGCYGQATFLVQKILIPEILA